MLCVHISVRLCQVPALLWNLRSCQTALPALLSPIIPETWAEDRGSACLPQGAVLTGGWCQLKSLQTSAARDEMVEIVKNMGSVLYGKIAQRFQVCSEDADPDCCYYQGRLSLNGIKNSNRRKGVERWKMCSIAQSGVRKQTSCGWRFWTWLSTREKACVMFAWFASDFLPN